jgi:hypothetical protein
VNRNKIKMMHIITLVCSVTTFIVPFVQLSIGFRYVVKDGQNAYNECPAASDLPLLMAIGGIFALFFLGIAYGLLKMFTSLDNPQSDIAGKMPKILVGMS